MAKIFISRFRVIGYRSCKNTEISLSPGVTALIGANGAGKTNLLQAFMLFGQTGSGLSRDNTYSQRCQVEVDFVCRKRLIQYRSVIVYRTTESNRDEVLSFDKEEWNFSGKRSSRIGWISSDYAGLIPRKRKGRFYFSIPAHLRTTKLKSSDISSALSFKKKPSKKQVEMTKNFNVAADLATFSNQMKYYSASQFTNPALSPTSFEIDENGKLRQEPVLRRSPHSKFMHDLYTLSNERAEVYELFLSFVDKRGVGLIDEFSWRAVEFLSETHEVRSGGKVERMKKERILIIPTVKIGTSRLSFNQLSEGTFRTLALIFYIVSDKNSLMIIEEPEVCVHHGLLSSVIAILKEYGRTKQIIFSTHSELVIDNLEPEQVRLLEYTPRKGTTVNAISDKLSKNRFAALKEYLATVGNLGEFWRHSGF
jgi:ABC-type uncharacterized transport system ATPase subunit